MPGQQARHGSQARGGMARAKGQFVFAGEILQERLNLGASGCLEALQLRHYRTEIRLRGALTLERFKAGLRFYLLTPGD